MNTHCDTGVRVRVAPTLACFLAALTIAPMLMAQEPAPPKAAKAQFDSGAAALKRGDAPRAVTAYRRAITIDPAYYAAHDAFIEATRRAYELSQKADTGWGWDFEDTLKMHRRHRADSLADAALTREYKGWSATKPRVAAYQWALGDLKGESPEAEPYYKKAVQLDPKLARAFEWLSLISEFRGDNAASAEYMRKASEADTTNGDYASYYADKFVTSDPARFRELSLKAAKRFAGTDKGASALSWLAYNTEGDSARAAMYEQLRSQFPLATSERSRDAMWNLFDTYARIAPDKALALAEEVLKLSTDADDQGSWAAKVVFARNLVFARSLAADHKYVAASAVLNATRVPKYSSDDDMFAVLRAEMADSAGNTKVAYDSLLVHFAKTPSDSAQAAIGRYAAKLHKSSAQVDSAVWAIRDTAAKPATPFRLASYGGPADSIALADYKGKVVLLTFWFPGCGPCRGEFPHFQSVANALKGRNFVYVGINVSPEQDAYVRPFMKGTQYSFTPLHGNDKFAKDAYKVRGEPTNFLIDGNGRIVFKDFMIHDAAAERMLTLMIESMLAHAGGGTSASAGQ
jgi:thiol-disulfide isomerase/thioredoxin/Tfp pilus assembly protein PilF